MTRERPHAGAGHRRQRPARTGRPGRAGRRVPAGGVCRRTALAGRSSRRSSPGTFEVLATDIDTLRPGRPRPPCATPSRASGPTWSSTAGPTRPWTPASPTRTPPSPSTPWAPATWPRRPRRSAPTSSTCPPTTSSTARRTGPTSSGTRPAPARSTARSKLGGEQEVRPSRAPTIVRTAWVSGAHGANMVEDRAAAGRGAPERHAALRRRPARVPDVHRRPGPGGRAPRPGPPPGTFHVTNQGETTWFGFVRAVAGRGRARPRAGAAPSAPPTSTRPARAAPRQLGAGQRRARGCAGCPRCPPWQDAPGPPGRRPAEPEPA